MRAWSYRSLILHAQQPPRTARSGPQPLHAQREGSNFTIAARLAASSSTWSTRVKSAAQLGSGAQSALASTDVRGVLPPLPLLDHAGAGGDFECDTEPGTREACGPGPVEEEDEGPYGGQHSARRRLGRREARAGPVSVGEAAAGPGAARESRAPWLGAAGLPHPQGGPQAPWPTSSGELISQQQQPPPDQHTETGPSPAGRGHSRCHGASPSQRPVERSRGQGQARVQSWSSPGPARDQQPQQQQRRPVPRHRHLGAPAPQPSEREAASSGQQQQRRRRHSDSQRKDPDPWTGPQAARGGQEAQQHHQQQQQQQQLRQQVHRSLIHARHCLSRALASAPSPADVEALLAASLAAAPRLALLDPVCVSAAVCRMVRLQRTGTGPGRGDHGHPVGSVAAGVLPVPPVQTGLRKVAGSSQGDCITGGSTRGPFRPPQQLQQRQRGERQLVGDSVGGYAEQREELEERAAGSAVGRWEGVAPATSPSMGRLEAAEAATAGTSVREHGGRLLPGQGQGRRMLEAEAATLATAGSEPRGGGGGVALAAGRAAALVAPAVSDRDGGGGGRSVEVEVGVAGGLTLAISPQQRAALQAPGVVPGLHDGHSGNSRSVSLAASGLTAATMVGSSSVGERPPLAGADPRHQLRGAWEPNRGPSAQASASRRFLQLVSAAVRQCLADAAAASADTRAAVPGPAPLHLAIAAANSSNSPRIVTSPSVLVQTHGLALWSDLAEQLRVQAAHSGGCVDGSRSGSAATRVLAEAVAEAESAVTAAAEAAVVLSAARVAPVGRFRPREVANVIWGLACLRRPDSRLCGQEADQQLLLRLAEELLPVPSSSSRPTAADSDPGVSSYQQPHEATATATPAPADADGNGSSSNSLKSSGDNKSWYSTNWRPGELAMLAWGMARAGVAPPSRRWLLTYIATWDEHVLTAAGAADLACLAWALARWQRIAARTMAWSRAVTDKYGRGSTTRPRLQQGRRVHRGGPAGPNTAGRFRLRRALPRTSGRGRRPAAPFLVQPLLPPAWLRAFWAASAMQLRRVSAGAAAAAAAGDVGARYAARALRRPNGAQPASDSVSNSIWGAQRYAAATASTTDNPACGPAEVAMLVWSVGRLELTPPDWWLEAALRAAAAVAPAAPPLALATTLRGAASIGAHAPVQDVAAAAAAAVDDEAAAARNGNDIGDAAAYSAPPLSRSSCAPMASECCATTDFEQQQQQQQQQPARPPLPLPPPLPNDSLRVRPRLPAAMPCQSLLAAFARVYLGRCAAALGRFGPSQVVDLLAAIQTLHAAGHLPAQEVLPLPISALLDAATARLQRCYSLGLGPRHLLAAAASLAAVGHSPPADWLDWWLDEMYGSCAAGRFRCHELAAVLRALAAFRVVPGPIWRATLLTAASRELRHSDRAGLTSLVEAMAAAGLRVGAGGGAATSATTGSAAGIDERASAGGVAGAAASAAAAPLSADATASWTWLSRFLRVWSGLRGAQRVSYYGQRSPLLRPPTARQTDRLCATLTCLAGPVAAWPAAPRAALRAALLRTPGIRQGATSPSPAEGRKGEGPAGQARRPETQRHVGRPGDPSGGHHGYRNGPHADAAGARVRRSSRCGELHLPDDLGALRAAACGLGLLAGGC